MYVTTIQPSPRIDCLLSLSPRQTQYTHTTYLLYLHISVTSPVNSLTPTLYFTPDTPGLLTAPLTTIVVNSICQNPKPTISPIVGQIFLKPINNRWNLRFCTKLMLFTMLVAGHLNAVGNHVEVPTFPARLTFS